MNKRTAKARTEKFLTREDDQNLYIEGYFAVFNSKYELWEDAFETIEPGAFDGETEKDIRALANHDTAIVLGRTTAGTLELKTDEHGLWGSILINRNDQDAVNLYERVKRGDVSQCSFGFDIEEQDVEYQEGRPTVWRIKKVRLYEVSVVTFPAYEETSVSARKNDFANIVKKRHEEWKKNIRKRLKGE